MRKCSKPFHSKRHSGLAVTVKYGAGGRLSTVVDYCHQAHRVVHDKGVQLMSNSLLTGLLSRCTTSPIFA